MLAAEVVDVLRSGTAPPSYGLVLVGGGRHVAVLLAEEPQQHPLGEPHVLEVVDEHVAESRGQPAAHVRLLVEEVEGPEHEVARVERAAVAKDAIVGLVNGGELELALGVGPLGVVPGLLLEGMRVPQVVARHDHLLLEPIDAGDDAAEQRGGVPAYLVVSQPKVVDPVEQQREPVRPRDRREERVDAPLDRLIPQQAHAKLTERGDPQLLPGRVHPRLERSSHRRGARARECERQDRVGRGPLRHEPREALLECPRLAGACTAEHQQRAAGVADGIELGGAERAGGGRHRS